jgi:hypothetical protein
MILIIFIHGELRQFVQVEQFRRPIMKSAPILALSLCLLAASGGVSAQSTDHTHVAGMDHGAMHGAALPTEPGQGAFAAIAEIVAMLAADPATDWQAVNITVLRDHLVDMDRLVTHARVTSRNVPDGLEMTIAVQDRDDSAVLRMVPAHGPVLASETGWTSDVTDAGDTLIWTVTDPAATARIRALGFFGLMATGDHHRRHHLGIATGKQVH